MISSVALNTTPSPGGHTVSLLPLSEPYLRNAIKEKPSTSYLLLLFHNRLKLLASLAMKVAIGSGSITKVPTTTNRVHRTQTKTFEALQTFQNTSVTS